MGRNPKHTHKAFFSKALIIIITSQADLMLLSSAPQSIKENHSTAGMFHVIICSPNNSYLLLSIQSPSSSSSVPPRC